MKDDLERYRSRCTRFLSGHHGNRPPGELLAAALNRDLRPDRYGDGGVVAELEDEVCKVLGKPAAVFMPSGTMAQQIALRIHADRTGRRAVGFHPTCHLEIREDKNYQRLHGLVGVTIGSPRALMTLDDLRAVPEPLAAVLWELPQREIGGVLPSWEALRAVYVSFYKGLGGVTGACLAGPKDVIAEARAWRKRHGGMLFQMWPYAASALAGLRERLPKMPRYYKHAMAIAAKLRSIPGVEVMPDPPQTPMMHILMRVQDKAFMAAAARIARERGIYTFRATMPAQSRTTRIVELSVGDKTLELTPTEVAAIVKELVVSR